MKYNVCVRLENGDWALLSHNNRQAWSKRHAQKLAREYKADNLRDAWIEEEFGS